MHSSSEQSRKRPDHSPRKNAEDREDERQSCLYIGNIDRKVQSGQLNDIFKKYGELEYCYLVYQPSSDRNSRQTKVSRGYGFAKFVKYEDLLKARNQLDGYEINGRRIKVQISKRNKPREATPGRYLGKKRSSPPQRHRGRSYSRSSSGSYYEQRRYHERKQKHKKRRQRSREPRERDRSRQKSGQYHRRKRSYSYQRQRRRERQ